MNTVKNPGASKFIESANRFSTLYEYLSHWTVAEALRTGVEVERAALVLDKQYHDPSDVSLRERLSREFVERCRQIDREHVAREDAYDTILQAFELYQSHPADYLLGVIEDMVDDLKRM